MQTITAPAVTTAPHATSRRNRVGVWIRRVALGLLVAMIALAVSGAIYQTVATARDRRAYPPSGRLVNVGGYTMHIDCRGTAAEGAPTVILESALAGTTSLWGWVQPEVANATRVCAYDRAGSGWSDPRPQPRDAEHFAAELQALLQAAAVAGPYVLVGHSYGGKYVRMYTAMYPDQVAGIVLVDASHPDQWTRTPEGQAEFRSFARLNTIGPILARFGVLRLFNMFPRNSDLPAQQSAELKAFADFDGLCDDQPRGVQRITRGGRPGTGDGTARCAAARCAHRDRPWLRLSRGSRGSAGQARRPPGAGAAVAGVPDRAAGALDK